MDDDKQQDMPQRIAEATRSMIEDLVELVASRTTTVGPAADRSEEMIRTRALAAIALQMVLTDMRHAARERMHDQIEAQKQQAIMQQLGGQLSGVK